MTIVKMDDLQNYLNGRFILRTVLRYGDRQFDQEQLRYFHIRYIQFTVIDKYGTIERFYVELEEFNRYTENIDIMDYRMKYLNETFGYCSPMKYIATFFNIEYDCDNIENECNHPQMSMWMSVKIERLIISMNSGDSILAYEETIQKYFLTKKYIYCDWKEVPDTAELLAGGKCEVFRNGDVFTVSIRTTASRYDLKTLKTKLMKVKSGVDDIAIDALCRSIEFKKLGLAPGYYKADKITLTKDRRLVYVFDLKDRIRELLKEKE